MQTFNNLEFAVALTIVAKASGIGPQGQERWRSGFHTRHGCARREFQAVPSRGFMGGEAAIRQGNYGKPSYSCGFSRQDCRVDVLRRFGEFADGWVNPERRP